jgi:uncharacterized protein YegP (UPF0339 family)
MSKNRIVIKSSKNKQVHVVVKGKNNKIIATTENYKRMQGATNAAKALKKVMKNAVVVDETKKSTTKRG